MSRRKILIAASIAGHATVFSGVFVAGSWDLEQLDADTKVRRALVVTGPLVPEGGSFDLPKAEMKPKPKPAAVRVVDRAFQPEEKQRPEVTITTEQEPDDGRDGNIGVGPGKGPGEGPCVATDGSCAPVAAQPPLPELPKPPEPPKPPKIENILPQILAGMRIRGETAIHPPREVYDEMYRSGNHRASADLKVCIAANGAVTSVGVLNPSGYPSYDGTLVAAVRRWLYRPYTVNGTPVPVCSAVKFRYEMK